MTISYILPCSPRYALSGWVFRHVSMPENLLHILMTIFSTLSVVTPDQAPLVFQLGAFPVSQAWEYISASLVVVGIPSDVLAL
jgi:hypothetical protein